MLVEGDQCDSDSKPLQVGSAKRFVPALTTLKIKLVQFKRVNEKLRRRLGLENSSVLAGPDLEEEDDKEDVLAGSDLEEEESRLRTLKLKLVQLKGVNGELRRQVLESNSVQAGSDLEEEEEESEDEEEVNEHEGYDKEGEVALRIVKIYEIAMEIRAGRCKDVDAKDRNMIFQMLHQAMSLSKDSSLPIKRVIDKIILIDYIMSTIMSDCGTN